MFESSKLTWPTFNKGVLLHENPSLFFPNSQIVFDKFDIKIGKLLEKKIGALTSLSHSSRTNMNTKMDPLNMMISQLNLLF